MLLEGVALRWLTRLPRDGELWLDFLLDASSGDGSVLSAEDVEGANDVGGSGKLRGNLFVLRSPDVARRGWDSGGGRLAV